MLLALRITIKIDCIYSLSMVLGTLTVCFSFAFWLARFIGNNKMRYKIRIRLYTVQRVGQIMRPNLMQLSCNICVNRCVCVWRFKLVYWCLRVNCSPKMVYFMHLYAESLYCMLS